MARSGNREREMLSVLTKTTRWVMTPAEPSLYDRALVWLSISLMVIGLVMVTSASIPISKITPFYYTYRDGFFIFGALVIGAIVVQIPVARWQQWSNILVLGSVLMLAAVLLVGHSVNGSSRWIPLGIFNLQPGEVSKLAMFLFVANFAARNLHYLQTSWKGIIKPVALWGLMAVLLLFQPDLGTCVVLLIGTLGILFVAGARTGPFILGIVALLVIVIGLIVFEPYRLARVTSFANPWADPYGSGYQLTQSLMAFGRGSWFGQGLGNSIQKLSYLPEAHTDFVFAIIAEELGFVGVTLILLVSFALVARAFKIGRRCVDAQQFFGGYFAFGVAFWFTFQIFVNVGAAAGIVPTKGLTLPFISYGGSSLFVMATAVAILIRIDHEYRVSQQHVVVGNDAPAITTM